MNIIDILKRAIYSFFVLLGLSILIFTIARVMPGDPARMALGPRVPQWAVDRVKEEMHLNDPVPIQYYYWIKGVLHGNFGMSLNTRRDVSDDIKQFFPASLELALYSAILLFVLGVILGTISGWFKNTWIDNLTRGISYIGVVTPSFAFAIFFVLIFSYKFRMFPTIGRLSSDLIPPPSITRLYTIDALISGQFNVFFDALKHLFLPVISLMMMPMAVNARLTRAVITENIAKDYIAFERSLGIPEKIIMFKYLLKPSLIPTISITGLAFANLLVNAFLIELIFNWPGLSRYGLNAILYKDLNAVVAVILVLGIMFIVVNVIVDLIVCYLDPTINIEMGRTQ